MTYDQTRICELFHLIGWTRIIWSRDFILASIVSIVTVCAFGVTGHTKDAITVLSPMLMTVSGALLAVSIAGLAIVVSMSNASYIALLKKAGIFETILMFYWVPAFSAGLSIALNGASVGLTILEAPSEVLAVSLFVSLFSFSYALAASIMVIGTTVRFGVYRGEFIAHGMEPELNVKNGKDSIDVADEESRTVDRKVET